MGKRELLLLVGFLAFGAIVYHVTAPPPDPTKESFSFSRFVGQVQAEFKGEHAETVVERKASAEPPSGEGRLVIPQFRGTLTILGENRRDLAAELKATVYGLDDEQAKSRARALNVSFEEKDDDLTTAIVLPPDVRRRPMLDLTIRVPSHLGIALELRNGQADLRHVGSVKLDNSRGRLTMADVGGVEGEFENGHLEIVRAHGVMLKLQRAQARFEEIAGDLTLEAGHGELRIQQVHGPTKLTLTRLDCELESIHGPITIEPDHVNLSVRNVIAPLTVKGAHTEVLATMAAAAPVTIETTDDQIDLRTPRQGVTIDARTDGGQIRVARMGSEAEPSETTEDVERPEKPELPERPEPRPQPDEPEKRERRSLRGWREPPAPPQPPEPPPGVDRRSTPGESNSRVRRATIKLHGGGPPIVLRNERGDIVIR